MCVEGTMIAHPVLPALIMIIFILASATRQVSPVLYIYNTIFLSAILVQLFTSLHPYLTYSTQIFLLEENIKNSVCVTFKLINAFI